MEEVILETNNHIDYLNAIDWCLNNVHFETFSINISKEYHYETCPERSRHEWLLWKKQHPNANEIALKHNWNKKIIISGFRFFNKEDALMFKLVNA